MTFPASPRIAGGAHASGLANGVALSDAYAYVANHDSGLTVLPAQCEATAGLSDDGGIPSRTLLGVHPNPCSRQALIEFATRHDGPARIGVYDAAGRCVRRLHAGGLPAGAHRGGRVRML
jgi:hypothetical protein